MMRPRIFFYVQHLLGIGHLRRAAAIARALGEHGLDVAFVSGGEPLPGLDLGTARIIQLPPARAGDSGFDTIVDGEGRPIDDAWRARRRVALLEAFRAEAPRLLLIELFPFGRRLFRFELLPLLEASQESRPRPAVVCSVRDILVSKSDPQRVAEIADIVRRYFDRVLVHGDPRLVRFEDTFAAADRIADRLHYTGYVISAPPNAAGASATGRGEVLVSAGGGAVGEPLLRAALAARPLTALTDAPWRIITGLNLPERVFSALRETAPGDVAIERFRPDFQALLRNCRLSVSQAGYNTVMELLAAGTRAVVVPFAEGGETEQPMRARLLAARELLTLVEPTDLTPRALAAAIDAADRRPPPAVSAIDLAGAAETARAIAALVTDGRRAPC
jgi:predicted glycosyltransferase